MNITAYDRHKELKLLKASLEKEDEDLFYKNPESYGDSDLDCKMFEKILDVECKIASMTQEILKEVLASRGIELEMWGQECNPTLTLKVDGKVILKEVEW